MTTTIEPRRGRGRPPATPAQRMARELRQHAKTLEAESRRLAIEAQKTRVVAGILDGRERVS